MSLSVEDLARLHADLAPALERLIVSITAGDVHTTSACRNDCLQRIRDLANLTVALQRMSSMARDRQIVPASSNPGPSSSNRLPLHHQHPPHQQAPPHPSHPPQHHHLHHLHHQHHQQQHHHQQQQQLLPQRPMIGIDPTQGRGLKLEQRPTMNVNVPNPMVSHPNHHPTQPQPSHHPTQPSSSDPSARTEGMIRAMMESGNPDLVRRAQQLMQASLPPSSSAMAQQQQQQMVQQQQNQTAQQQQQQQMMELHQQRQYLEMRQLQRAQQRAALEDSSRAGAEVAAGQTNEGVDLNASRKRPAEDEVIEIE